MKQKKEREKTTCSTNYYMHTALSISTTKSSRGTKPHGGENMAPHLRLCHCCRWKHVPKRDSNNNTFSSRVSEVWYARTLSLRRTAYNAMAWDGEAAGSQHRRLELAKADEKGLKFLTGASKATRVSKANQQGPPSPTRFSNTHQQGFNIADSSWQSKPTGSSIADPSWQSEPAESNVADSSKQGESAGGWHLPTS